VRADASALSVVANGGLTFGALNDGRISRRATPQADFGLRRWHHVAATYSMCHNEQHLFVDGVEKPVGSPGRVFAIDSTGTVLRIGNQDGGERWGSNNHWVGRLDDIRIYSRPLSSGEIAVLSRKE
jgi:hypothetical protein